MEFLRAKTLPDEDGPIAPVGPVLPVAPVFVANPWGPVSPVNPLGPILPVGPVYPVAPLKVPSTLILPCNVILTPVCPILIAPSLESIKNAPVPIRWIKLVSWFIKSILVNDISEIIDIIYNFTIKINNIICVTININMYFLY